MFSARSVQHRNPSTFQPESLLFGNINNQHLNRGTVFRGFNHRMQLPFLCSFSLSTRRQATFWLLSAPFSNEVIVPFMAQFLYIGRPIAHLTLPVHAHTNRLRKRTQGIITFRPSAQFSESLQSKQVLLRTGHEGPARWGVERIPLTL